MPKDSGRHKAGKARPRLGVRAIIVQDGRLLAVRKQDTDRPLYSFPGGGQKAGETLVQALRREVREETGQEIQVGALLFVREYIGKYHENAAIDAAVHVVDHLFRCTLADPAAALRALKPDRDQAGVEWLPVAQLAAYRFFPRALIPALIALAAAAPLPGPVYLGDVN